MQNDYITDFVPTDPLDERGFNLLDKRVRIKCSTTFFPKKNLKNTVCF